MKLLVADDDRVCLRMLEGTLTNWGFEVISATDGSEAWRILEEDEAPRLAILDRSMPGLDGLEICRRLRQKPTPTPTYVILLTGHSAKADIVTGLEAGANDYITKPFHLDELRARVQAGRTVVDLQAKVAQQKRELELMVHLLWPNDASQP